MSHCGVIGTVRCDSGERRLANSPHDPLANMTTPDPEDLYRMLAEMVSDGVDTVIMEATSHALALGKLDALHFDVAVFTNLTPEHLDFHGDMEQYFLAKSKLFDMCDLAVINGDAANIVVRTEEQLNASQLAQINAVVYEQAGIEPVNITIVAKS